MAHFQKSETGAVTVDWVVLTAGLVGLGLATMSVVSTGVQDTANDVDSALKQDGIIQTSFGLDLLGILEQWYATPYIQNTGGTATAQSSYDSLQANAAGYPDFILTMSHTTHSNDLTKAQAIVAGVETVLAGWDDNNPDWAALDQAIADAGGTSLGHQGDVIQSEGLANYLELHQINIEMQTAILDLYETELDERGIAY